MGSVGLVELRSHLDRFLAIDRFKDACPNGLQVEGTRDVSRVALGVTASLELIRRARFERADAIVVHHGLFWSSPESLRVERSLRSRLAELLESGMSLLAYHLPLDAHLEVGNNAILARELGARDVEPGFEWNGTHVGVTARFESPLPAEEVIGRVTRITARDPLVVDAGPPLVSRLGIVSGAAAGLVGEAARAGLDLFLTGEPRESATHVAREERIHLVCGGHHATERFGVKALGEHIERELGIDAFYIEVANPV